MRNKIFEFTDPGPDFEPIITRMTGEEILNSYYPYWSDQMDERFGVGRDRSKDVERCIQDFCAVNWAYEVN